MTDAKVFNLSRPNLYHEVRPKKDVVKQIIGYVQPSKSGIIYCLSRKKVEG